MVYLIIGRTGRGKDTLARILEKEHDMKVLKSYATRPPRYKGEDTHVFISKEEFDRIPEEERVAYAKIGDYEYCATRAQIDESDVYVINPDAIEGLLKKMPHTAFTSVYIHADEDDAWEHALARADDPEKEMEKYTKRSEAENEQFTAYEEKLKANQSDKIGMTLYMSINNDYEPETLKYAACTIAAEKRMHDRSLSLVRKLVADGAFGVQQDNGLITAKREDESEEDCGFTIGIDQLAVMAIRQPEVAIQILGHLIRAATDESWANLRLNTGIGVGRNILNEIANVQESYGKILEEKLRAKQAGETNTKNEQ